MNRTNCGTIGCGAPAQAGRPRRGWVQIHYGDTGRRLWFCSEECVGVAFTPVYLQERDGDRLHILSKLVGTELRPGLSPVELGAALSQAVANIVVQEAITEVRNADVPTSA